jgi:alkanesulfonate monooxygenase SsuD/methylene tetrahydromethanopterin reductase-like flavin-dependent oxidoreductase (luciferase family)
VNRVRPQDLKVGLYIPNGDGSMTTTAKHWNDILELSVAAEHAGLDSVWVADHMIFDFPNVEIQGRWECWTVLAAIAQATSRVEIGPLVSCLGFRNPALLAKMAETVDEISGGRLILAVGAGWHEPEFTTYGFPFDHRASRFEESFEVIYRLIRDGEVDFTGTYVSAPSCKLRPRGPRNGALPILVGTDGPRLLKLTAKYADGWNTTWSRSVDEVLPRIEALDAACDDIGRDPATIGRSCCVHLDLPEAEGVWMHTGLVPPTPRNTSQAAEFLASYADAGIDHVMLWLDPCTVDAVEQAGEVVRRLRGGR